MGVAIAVCACGLTGPGKPERQIVGRYRGSWIFGIYNPDTIARGSDPPGDHSRGFVYCPGELQITRQDGRDIEGRIELQGPGRSCHSRDASFCTDTLIAKFCRPVSGTLKGEAFSTGAPSATTILFEARIAIGQSEGRAALSRLVGCTVVAEQQEVFKGGVRMDVTASASTDATAECGGEAGLERIDLAIRLDAERVTP